MEASLPREIAVENGVRTFCLSAEQYRNAGALMDVMMQDEDICRTGCFVVSGGLTRLRESTISVGPILRLGITPVISNHV